MEQAIEKKQEKERVWRLDRRKEEIHEERQKERQNELPASP